MMSAFQMIAIFVVVYFFVQPSAGKESLENGNVSASNDDHHDVYFDHYAELKGEPAAKAGTTSSPVPNGSGGGKDDDTHGSCFLSLNSTGQVHQKCIDKLKLADSTLKNINIDLDPEQVKLNDIGMYCSIWIKMAVCLVNTTCAQCADEGALVEHFIKEETRKLYERKCRNTSVTFAPLNRVLCDVTVSTKTGLIIAVVVLSLLLLVNCTFICLLASRLNKKQTADKQEKEKESQASVAQAVASSKANKSSHSKQNPGKLQKQSKVGK